MKKDYVNAQKLCHMSEHSSINCCMSQFHKLQILCAMNFNSHIH